MAVHIAKAPQSSTAARLSELLQRARNVKPSTSIEPPLQVSELVPDEESLFGDISGEKEILSVALESAAKGVFYSTIVRSLSLPYNQANGARVQPRSMSQRS